METDELAARLFKKLDEETGRQATALQVGRARLSTLREYIEALVKGFENRGLHVVDHVKDAAWAGDRYEFSFNVDGRAMSFITYENDIECVWVSKSVFDKLAEDLHGVPIRRRNHFYGEHDSRRGQAGFPPESMDGLYHAIDAMVTKAALKKRS